MSKPISSERAEARSIIERTFQELGGRATAAEIYAHVGLIADDHLDEHMRNQGWLRAIGEYLRSTNGDGLPVAPHIGDRIHMDLELFSVEDYRWVIKEQVESSRSARIRAERYQAKCLEQHGVLIDLSDPMAGAA